MGAAWLSRLREAAGPVGFGAAVSEGFAGSAAGPGALRSAALPCPGLEPDAPNIPVDVEVAL